MTQGRDAEPVIFQARGLYLSPRGHGAVTGPCVSGLMWGPVSTQPGLKLKPSSSGGSWGVKKAAGRIKPLGVILASVIWQ